MQTILYDTFNGRTIGEFREGQYLVDGRPGQLSETVVELTVVQTSDSYNPATEYLVRQDSVDVENLHYVQHFVATPIPVGADVPPMVFARDLRLALIGGGVSMATIDNVIAAIPNEVERETVRVYWQYTLQIKRDHPLILQFASVLGLNSTQVDELFKAAAAISISS